MDKLPEDYMYPDNTCDGMPDKKEGEKSSPALTTGKTEEKLEHIPGLGMQENIFVDILDYITKNIHLTNQQIVSILEVLYEAKDMQDT